MINQQDLKYADGSIYPLNFKAGVKRDGTNFASRYWTDILWARFQRELPRKIGGYRSIVAGLPNITRGVQVVNRSSNFNLYIADFESLKYYDMDQDGFITNPVPFDRTPVGFIANPDNDWSFDIMYDTTSNNATLIAHASPTLQAIENETERSVYYGNIASTTPLVNTGLPPVSGGVSVFHPYLFTFGNNGYVHFSEPNNPTSTLGTARVTSEKVVAGFPTRGGNSSPAGLLWSLDSLIRVTKVNSDVEFVFDTVAGQSSILSQNGIVEYDGVFFWIGVDRWFFYNGQINELPNASNRNFFFDNLNFDYRNKVWAAKVTEFGEIWFHFPFGTDTECSCAVIYNVRENCWYDTGDPRQSSLYKFSRSAGTLNPVFGSPVWADGGVNGGGTTEIWLQEEGKNRVEDEVPAPIDSFVRSGSVSWCAVGPDNQYHGMDKTVDLYRVEPDLIQSGNMNLYVEGNAYARSSNDISAPFVFGPTTEKIDIHEQRREMYLRFESNELDGDYQFGQNIAVMRLGDTRP